MMDKSDWVPTDDFLQKHCLECGLRFQGVAPEDGFIFLLGESTI